MRFIRSLNAFIFDLFLSPILLFAQDNLQNIRGTVVDKLSQSPHIGASIQIINVSENKGTATDENGQYTLHDPAPDR